MYLIDELNEEITSILGDLGIKENAKVVVSNKPELGDYQYNGCMSLAGKLHINPRDLAEKIVQKLSSNTRYKNVNIAGPGFINISFSDKPLIEYMNTISSNSRTKQEAIQIAQQHTDDFYRIAKKTA